MKCTTFTASECSETGQDVVSQGRRDGVGSGADTGGVFGCSDAPPLRLSANFFYIQLPLTEELGYQFQNFEVDSYFTQVKCNVVISNNHLHAQ